MKLIKLGIILCGILGAIFVIPAEYALSNVGIWHMGTAPHDPVCILFQLILGFLIGMIIPLVILVIIGAIGCGIHWLASINIRNEIDELRGRRVPDPETEQPEAQNNDWMFNNPALLGGNFFSDIAIRNSFFNN